MSIVISIIWSSTPEPVRENSRLTAKFPLNIGRQTFTYMLNIYIYIYICSIRLTILEQMWFEDFQDGCHGGYLGYQNQTIFAILTLQAAPMPFTKFLLHPTYGSGADNNWRLLRWPPWRPAWIRFWRRCRKCEKLLTDIRMRDGPPGAKLQVS